MGSIMDFFFGSTFRYIISAGLILTLITLVLNSSKFLSKNTEDKIKKIENTINSTSKEISELDKKNAKTALRKMKLKRLIIIAISTGIMCYTPLVIELLKPKEPTKTNDGPIYGDFEAPVKVFLDEWLFTLTLENGDELDYGKPYEFTGDFNVLLLNPSTKEVLYSADKDKPNEYSFDTVKEGPYLLVIQSISEDYCPYQKEVEFYKGGIDGSSWIKDVVIMPSYFSTTGDFSLSLTDPKGNPLISRKMELNIGFFTYVFKTNADGSLPFVSILATGEEPEFYICDSLKTMEANFGESLGVYGKRTLEVQLSEIPEYENVFELSINKLLLEIPERGAIYGHPEPLSNIYVTLINRKTNISYRHSIYKNKKFHYYNLPFGEYSVSVEVPGFKNFSGIIRHTKEATYSVGEPYLPSSNEYRAEIYLIPNSHKFLHKFKIRVLDSDLKAIKKTEFAITPKTSEVLFFTSFLTDKDGYSPIIESYENEWIMHTLMEVDDDSWLTSDYFIDRMEFSISSNANGVQVIEIVIP